MDFESVAQVFWDKNAQHEVQPPLTDAMVARAEAALGVRLPDTYVALLRIQNGGYIADAFRAHPAPEPTSWAADRVAFDSMFGIGKQDEGILQNPYFLREWEMPDGLILLSGDGHWWIALDYRRSGPSGPPSVVWYDNEVGEGVQLAADFETFVLGLPSEWTFAQE
jgi:hypothetical protein